MDNKRTVWLDIAKAFSIFAVVFGHTLRGGNGQLVVYSFHVVCFFLLSGMTCKTDNIGKRIKNDFLRIMVPYYAFGIISIVIFAVLGKFVAGSFELDVNTSVGNNLWELFYACPMGSRMKFNMPLWFLPCLFITKLLYYAIDKLCRGKKLLILGTGALCYALGFIYSRFVNVGLPFHLSLSLKMILFFSIGRVFFLWISEYKGSFFKSRWILLIGITIFAANSVLALFVPFVSYVADSFPNVITFTLTALLGSFSICFIAMGIGNFKVLQYIGRHTLAILVMHKFPILLFQTLGPSKAILQRYDSLEGIGMAIVVSLVAIALCLLVEKLIQKVFPFLLGDFSVFSRKNVSE